MTLLQLQILRRPPVEMQVEPPGGRGKTGLSSYFCITALVLPNPSGNSRQAVSLSEPQKTGGYNGNRCREAWVGSHVPSVGFTTAFCGHLLCSGAVYRSSYVTSQTAHVGHRVVKQKVYSACGATQTQSRQLAGVQGGVAGGAGGLAGRTSVSVQRDSVSCRPDTTGSAGKWFIHGGSKVTAV